jgi:uncharacterized protein YggU (UPF0235/DUF167 family)
VNGLDAAVHDVPGGASLRVRVIPRAGATTIGGIRDGRLLIRLAAAPVDDAANDALRAFLSKSLGVRARDIALAAGAHDRSKRVVLSGTSGAEVKRRLAELLASEGSRRASGCRDSR